MRVPHSCRHYRRESLIKYPFSPFGKHSHRALIRQVLRDKPKARLQDMMYPAPQKLWLSHPSYNTTITGVEKSVDKDLSDTLDSTPESQ